MDNPSLKQALSSIEKDYDLSVRKLSDMPTLQVDAIPTGSLLLDNALGVGGYPRGRIIEIYGAPSGGKSSISLMGAAQAQKRGGQAAFIDVEHAFSKPYASALGVDVENLYFVQPDYGEQALEVLERLVSTNEFDFIVLDSVAALVPKAEQDADMDKESMGLQPKLMSKALRKLTPIVGKTKTVAVFINQTRQSMAMYGSPVTTPGGEALKFYSSVRLNVRKMSGSEIKRGDEILGHRIHINVVKNKVAPPLKTAELNFLFGKGIDTSLDMIEFALNCGAVTTQGNTYFLGDQKLAVGRDNTIEVIRQDPLLQEAIIQWVNSHK